MRRELLNILRAAARRLLLTRAAEAAAVCAGAVGLCAAMLELAWAVAGRTPFLAATFCAAALVLGILFGAVRPVRRRLGVERRVALAAGGVWVAAAAAGLLLVAAGLYTRLPKALLPVVILPAGAVAGAAAVALRRVSIRRAAIYLDITAGTGERLSTAAELAESDQADTPPARFLYDQALSAAARARAGRRPLWRRTRATAGALGLVVVLCGALGALPSLERARPAPAAVTTADSRPAAIRLVRLPADVDAAAFTVVSRMSPERRARLADVLRRAAEAESDPAKAQALRDAAAAIEAGDAEALREKMELLASARAEVPHTLAEALRARARDTRRRVNVYDPFYAKAVAAAQASAQAADAGADETAGPGLVPRDDAWAAARRRAREALAEGGKIPPEYRQLVRDFFLSGS